MGDVGDMYNDMKKESKERRAKHRGMAPIKLNAEGINFESKNMGALDQDEENLLDKTNNALQMGLMGTKPKRD